MIEKIKHYRQYFIDLFKLSLPILAGNISQILIGFVDTITAGRYSTTALGAISVASAIIMTVTIGAIGLILSVSPVIANLRGKKQPAKKYFKSTIIFAITISIPFYIITKILLYNIDFIGLDPSLIEGVKTYISVCAVTIFPTSIFVALKEFLQAYEKVVFANSLMFFMVFLNLVLNIILTFGFDIGSVHFMGLGVLGLSIATLLSKTVACIIMLLYCIPLFKGKLVQSTDYIKDLFKVGTPISAAIFFEFLGFNMTAVLIGKFSALYAGVHNIVLCIANFTFMIVLAIANAASIKIGYFSGRKDVLSIKRYALTGIYMTLIVCLITFTLIGFESDFIVGIFSKDPNVLVLCKKILKFAMIFLFFDGIQGTCVGILKGLKDTKIIMFTMLFAYLVIAIPIGSYLAFKHNLVLEGYWFGLSVALAFAAIVTTSRVIYDIKKASKHMG